VVGKTGGLDEAVRDVDPESVDPAVEPEAQDAAELGPHVGVRPVEIGLRRVEEVQVPLSGGAVGLGDARPRRTAEDRLPVVRGHVSMQALAVAEHVARTLGAARLGRERRLEPLVLVGRVVGDQVDDEADAAGMRLGDQLVEVVERAEDGIDVAVVGDIVAGILLRRGHERRQPQRVDAELGQVVEVRRDAPQIADAVAVRIREGARVDLVDHGRAPPLPTGVGGEGEGVREHGDVRGGHPSRIRQALARRALRRAARDLVPDTPRACTSAPRVVRGTSCETPRIPSPRGRSPAETRRGGPDPWSFAGGVRDGGALGWARADT
jgi:hypothetical protein